MEKAGIPAALDQTRNTSHFLVAGLCGQMYLRPRQAASLLSPNNRYLGQVLVNGVRGSYAPVVNWCQQVFNFSGTLAGHLANRSDRQLLPSVLGIMRNILRSNDAGPSHTCTVSCALQSCASVMCFHASRDGRSLHGDTAQPCESWMLIASVFYGLLRFVFFSSPGVAVWGCRILGRLGFDLNRQNMGPLCWKWFTFTGRAGSPDLEGEDRGAPPASPLPRRSRLARFPPPGPRAPRRRR